MGPTVDERARLQQALELNAIGAWDWDIAANQVNWSDGIYEILGLDRDATPSYQLALDHVFEADRARYEEAIDVCMDGKGHYDLRNRIRRANGTIRSVISLGRVQRDAAGVAVRMYGTLQDVTVAEETAQRNREFEARMVQISRLESLGRLASGIAHDFNNALLPIKLAAGLLEQSTDATSNRLGKEILSALEHAEALPQQIRDFSGKSSNAGLRDLRDVVEAILPLLRRSVGKSVQIEFIRGEEELGCWMDDKQIERVCVNLALNSKDAMAAGGKLVFETLPSKDGGSAALRVRDWGVGIEPDALHRVVEPFYTTKPTGTGLGLAMVFACARAHGGDCTIESEVNAGTVVTVTIPIYTPGAASLPAILVVDDEPMVLSSLVSLLRSSGHTVWSAGTPDEARDLAALHPVDLLLTDVNMPELNGPALAAELTDSRPGLRVLFMSGDPDSVVPNDARVLVKPFSVESIEAAVAHAVQ